VTHNSLFATYRQGENRVTASMLAVFERLDVSRLERLLAAAMGDASVQLVSFQNQIAGTASQTVPDARISAQFSLWIETKTSVGAVRAEQLRGHLEHMRADRSVFERLIVLTPDAEEPPQIAQVGDDRVVWVAFADLTQAIQDLLSNPAEVVSEREQVLLRELVQMFEEDGLLALPDDTVIVAARQAFDEYLRYHAYVCQSGRSFRPGLTYMGFYRHKQIEPLIPAIIARRDDIILSEDRANELEAGDQIDRSLAGLIRTLTSEGARPVGNLNQIFLLSPPDDEHTLDLGEPILHRGRSAWTQNQRYTTSKNLQGAKSADEL